MSTPTLLLETTVSALIDEEHKGKENLICQHFILKDADHIISSPLPRIPRPDQPLWSYDNGNYSIKSRYQVAFRLKMPDCPRPSKSSLT